MVESVRPQLAFRRLMRRRHSLSRRAALVLFGTYVLLTVGLGLGFALMGAWLILPFVGLEIGVIAAVMFAVGRRARDYELVVVDADFVRLVRRQGNNKACFEFRRYWAQVSLARAEVDWYPARVLIRSHGREVEVGKWIGEDARAALAADLSRFCGTAFRAGRTRPGVS